MTEKTYSFNLKKIKSFSVIVPDTNIIIHYVLREEEFTKKIDFLIDNLEKNGFVFEILPAVSLEITKKLMDASQDYVEILNKFKKSITWITKKKLENIVLEKNTIELIEKTSDYVLRDIYHSFYKKYKMKIDLQRRARIVETAIILELLEILKQKNTITLNTFFDGLENQLKDTYNEFFKMQLKLFLDTKAKILKEKDCLHATKDLEKILLNKCRVKNRKDVIVLMEAISRMYQTNKWYSIVSVDYKDMIRNRFLIENHTLLTCCDPLYFLYHLEEKIDFALHPKEGAARKKIPFGTFVAFPKQPGLI